MLAVDSWTCRKLWGRLCCMACCCKGTELLLSAGAVAWVSKHGFKKVRPRERLWCWQAGLFRLSMQLAYCCWLAGLYSTAVA